MQKQFCQQIVFTITVVLLIMVFDSANAADRALLVGIGQYQNNLEDLPNLPGIDVDIQRMKKAAILLGYESEQIMVLQDQNATADNVEKAIRNWLGQAGINDHILFYFSGHGTRVYDESADEVDGVDEVLCFHDLEMVHKDGKYSFEGVITDDRFQVILRQLTSENILIVLDHCFSGTSTKALNFNDNVKDTLYVSKAFQYIGMPLSGKSLLARNTVKELDFFKPVVLSSCRDDEESVSSATGSLFTEGLSFAIEERLSMSGTFDTRYLLDYSTRYISTILKSTDTSRIFHPQLQGNMVLTIHSSQ